MSGEAAGIAHDVNNLLTAILGGADAIADRAGLDEDMREAAEAIRASARRASALMGHLIAADGGQPLEPRALALNEALATLAPTLRLLLGGGVRLDLALEQPGRTVRMDPMALDRVVVNLVVNADKAMPGGGVLTLRTGHLTVRDMPPAGPEPVPPGSYAVLEARDTGTGIPPEVLPHIFEPFFTTRRGSGGTGLGLCGVRDLVRRSGGYVAVESAPGQGTRMRVLLPVCQGDAVTPRPEADPRLPLADAPPPPPGAVLLVEDEDVVRHVTERALARRGWRVLAAATPEAALTVLEGPPPAIAAIVTDLAMPGMDGAALVRAVRARLGQPRLPAILTSGYAAEALPCERAAEADAPRFLRKPYEIGDLVALLRELEG